MTNTGGTWGRVEQTMTGRTNTRQKNFARCGDINVRRVVSYLESGMEGEEYLVLWFGAIYQPALMLPEWSFVWIMEELGYHVEKRKEAL